MRFTSALSRHGQAGPTGSVGLQAPGEPVACVVPAQLLGEASWHGGLEALGEAVVRLVPAQFLEEPAGACVGVDHDQLGAGHLGEVPQVLGVQGLSLIHISEPTRLGMISYAVFCLKK